MTEKTIQRSSLPQLDQILGKEFPCLNHGFVRLIDYLGSDAAVVEAARVSYGKGTKQVQEDRRLIRYLMRHQHTSPFEMVEFKFHCKLPIFVARQWIRHRTASVNEYSLRYSEAENQFYLPEPEVIRQQSKSNRQGRAEETVPEAQQLEVLTILKQHAQQAWLDYEKLAKINLARELARIHLPVSLYTEWYWKINLHNLFHFLKLRLDPTAQYEIRVYAGAIAQIVKLAVPLSWEAFEDFVLYAENFSRLELEIIKNLIADSTSITKIEQVAREKGLSAGEIKELLTKLNRSK